MTDLEEFVQQLRDDPKLVERLQKQEEFRAFKEKYNTERATPLKCPVCSTFYQWPGSLWIDKDDNTKFVCRKCHLHYTIICHTIPNISLIDELRQIGKGEEGGLPSWLKGE